MDPEDNLIEADSLSFDKVVEGEISAIDLGSKDVDFDELIIFTHTYLNYRKCECITKEIEPFSVLLTNNEFLMLSSTILEENTLNNKEIVPIVKKKVLDYSGYEPAQKTNFLEAMPSYAKEIGFELTVDLFFPILLKIISERDIIIEKFLHIFKKFIEFLSLHREEGYKMIRDHMIPIINDIIQKKKNDDKIMKLCSDALLDVVKFIRDEDKGQSILTIIITLANNDDDKEKDRCKTIAAQLQNDLAPFIGQESCEMWIVPQISSFAEDHAHGVRKSVLKNFMKICETVSHDCFIHRLLPIYEKLAKDSLWTVRKPAVEILPLLTKLCDSNTISKVLLPLYKAFESDSKNYVKHSAVEIFGQFITLLSPNDRSEDLLEYYINIVHDINSKDQEDLSIACHCAYNFPAVLFAYGKEQWDKLKPCFDKFALENNEKIKGPIASALGEIANIVGPKITERDILPYVNKFYNDNKLQSRILIVLPDIVRNVSSSKKLYYLEYLKAMIPSKEKWRKRMEHAKIICKFHQIYSDDILYKRVFPIAVNICFDNVAKVRFKAAKFISKMFLQLLSSETEYKSKTFMILLCFAQSINFNYRQLFIRMCQDLYSNEKLITDEIIDYIYDLAYDNVLNVRITLAKSLAKILKENSKS